MNFSQKQKDIITSDKNKVVVIATAAAGKTATLTARIKYLIVEKKINPKEIVAITFTNLAAEEIRERISDIAKDCFIGTVHSYCNYLLLSNGIDTHSYIEKEEFDKLFGLIKKHPECIRHVEHLLLDEAQDSNEAQFSFFLKSIKPVNFMFVGDHRQSIYRFAGAMPTQLIELTKDPTVTVYQLDENYRNSKTILDYAQSIIGQNGMDYIDTSIPMSEKNGRVVSVEYSPTGIANTIRKMGNFKNWFILSRWNSDIPMLQAACEKSNVPYTVIRRRDFATNEELRDKLKEDSVKIMTIHASKGLEADNVVVVGANMNKSGGEENICVDYVAATRAKELLVWTYKTRKTKRSVSNWE